MQAELWKSRWSEGRIAFHEGVPNTFLERHAERIANSRRVLVPLCGKAEDLAYLAALGHDVVGIELVEDAVRAFFAEHGTSPVITRGPRLAEYRAGSITILAGDLFDVTAADTGTVDAIYDRAALIALPAALRRKYVDHLRSLAPERTPALLVTLEYPQDKLEGPPFAVLEPEVRALYRSTEQIDERPASGGRIAEAGLSAIERCYAVVL